MKDTQIADLKRALATKDLRLSVSRAEQLDLRMQLQVSFNALHAVLTVLTVCCAWGLILLSTGRAVKSVQRRSSLHLRSASSRQRERPRPCSSYVLGFARVMGIRSAACRPRRLSCRGRMRSSPLPPRSVASSVRSSSMQRQVPLPRTNWPRYFELSLRYLSQQAYRASSCRGAPSMGHSRTLVHGSRQPAQQQRITAAAGALPLGMRHRFHFRQDVRRERRLMQGRGWRFLA
jgi:hypothetical protein